MANKLIIINTYVKKIDPKLNGFINTFKYPQVQIWQIYF
jgi:hypothetical protein